MTPRRNSTIDGIYFRSELQHAIVTFLKEKPLTRAELLRKIYGRQDADDQTLRNLLNRTRRTLAPHGLTINRLGGGDHCKNETYRLEKTVSVTDIKKASIFLNFADKGQNEIKTLRAALSALEQQL